MVSYIESHFKCYVRQHLTKSKCKVRAYIKNTMQKWMVKYYMIMASHIENLFELYVRQHLTNRKCKVQAYKRNIMQKCQAAPYIKEM